MYNNPLFGKHPQLKRLQNQHQEMSEKYLQEIPRPAVHPADAVVIQQIGIVS
jgi:hypothetical protein